MAARTISSRVTQGPHGGKTRFNPDAVEIKSKRSHASRVSGLVLQTVTHNERRHELQRFMLATTQLLWRTKYRSISRQVIWGI